jgi:type II secretion system protein L
MPGQMIGLLEGDTLTLRTADAPPLVLPALSVTDAFEIALSMQTSAVAGLEPAPLGLLLYAGHDEWEAHQLQIDAFRDRFTGVKVQLLPRGSLSVLAPAAAADDAVNLLQGALAVSSPTELTWRSWRIAAVLAASLLCLHLGARFYELNRLRKAETSLDAGIEQAFRAAMPGQQNATNARRRVEKRLLELQGGGARGTLLPALLAIANARGAVPSATIEGFTFRDGTIDLRIDTPDAASLDAIGQQLRSASWQANIMGGNVNGDVYKGRLQIRKAGA